MRIPARGIRVSRIVYLSVRCYGNSFRRIESCSYVRIARRATHVYAYASIYTIHYTLYPDGCVQSRPDKKIGLKGPARRASKLVQQSRRVSYV